MSGTCRAPAKPPGRRSVAGAVSQAVQSLVDGLPPVDPRHSRKADPVLRLLRLLPVLIPIVTAASRNPKVRELLHLKPRPEQGRQTKR
jgi:hypothetical protein